MRNQRMGKDTMDGRKRSDIAPGARVAVIQKQDQRTGDRTEGIVKDILTKSPIHTRGIKVRLTTGVVGRVAEILSQTSEIGKSHAAL